jgi:DNA-binding FrmR family transcriptional regulator
MTEQHKEKAIVSLRKAQSSIGKMIDMLESGRYCIDVMQQNMAVIGLLKSAHQTLMEGHLKSCFATAMSTGNAKKKEAMTAEILKVASLLNK